MQKMMDGIGSIESHVFQKFEDTDQSDPDQVQCSQGMHSVDQHAKHQPEFLKACLTISKKCFKLLIHNFQLFSIRIFLSPLND